MKRFFTIFALALIVSVTASAQNKFFTWVGYSDTRDWDAYFQELSDIGMNGILINSGREGLEKVIPIAEKYGIEVHAWLWIMNNGGIASQHPEWLDYNQNGESLKDKKAYVDYYKFLNPIIPEARAAIADGIAEVAKTKGLKGISLDYCRYVDAILPEALWASYGIKQDKVYAEWDYGYHPMMIEAYAKKYGKQPAADDSQWLDFRCEVLNNFVDSLAGIVKGAGLKFSASPFPTPEMAKEMVRQDWGKWPLDMAFPMIYHGFYYGDEKWVAKCVSDCRRDMDPKSELYLGMHIPDFGNPKGPTLTQTMQAAFDNGAKGVSMYTFDSLSPELKKELKAFIQSHK